MDLAYAEKVANARMRLIAAGVEVPEQPPAADASADDAAAGDAAGAAPDPQKALLLQIGLVTSSVKTCLKHWNLTGQRPRGVTDLKHCFSCVDLGLVLVCWHVAPGSWFDFSLSRCCFLFDPSLILV